MPPVVGASVACAPPASAASNRRRPVERVASPSTLRCRCIRRWPYSRVRSSSAAEMRTRNPSRCRTGRLGARNAGTSNRPSPRLASVIGQSPTTALALAMRARLAGVGMGGMDEAPAASSTSTVSSSRSIGRWPCAARQSSTSRVCSLTWMCAGRPRQVARPTADRRASRRAASAARCRCCRRAPGSPSAAHRKSRSFSEAALRRRRRLAEEAALAIEHRQQGQADADRVGCGHDALRHLGRRCRRAGRRAGGAGSGTRPPR